MFTCMPCGFPVLFLTLTLDSIFLILYGVSHNTLYIINRLQGRNGPNSVLILET